MTGYSLPTDGIAVFWLQVFNPEVSPELYRIREAMLIIAMVEGNM